MIEIYTNILKFERASISLVNAMVWCIGCMLCLFIRFDVKYMKRGLAVLKQLIINVFEFYTPVYGLA